MPRRRSKPPSSGNLPPRGKRILAAAYESAKTRALEDGKSEKAAKRSASAQAWCAVKRQYFKRGARWYKRRDPLGRDDHPPGCRPLRRRNPMLSRPKREALSRELGGGLHADATVDELMAYMRSLESRGRITYDDDLEQDPTTPKPDLEDLWDELWSNYGDDTLGNPRDFDLPEVVEEEEEDEDEEFDLSEMRYRDPIYEQFGQDYNPGRVSASERDVLERLADDAARSRDDWGTVTSIDGYLADPTNKLRPLDYLTAVEQGVYWNLEHYGENDDDKASAARAITRIERAREELSRRPSGSAPRNPYMGDAVELAKQRKYEEQRRKWEREGRRGPPPAPLRQRNPREATLARRIAGRS